MDLGDKQIALYFKTIKSKAKSINLVSNAVNDNK